MEHKIGAEVASAGCGCACKNALACARMARCCLRTNLGAQRARDVEITACTLHACPSLCMQIWVCSAHATSSLRHVRPPFCAPRALGMRQVQELFRAGAGNGTLHIRPINAGHGSRRAHLGNNGRFGDRRTLSPIDFDAFSGSNAVSHQLVSTPWQHGRRGFIRSPLGWLIVREVDITIGAQVQHARSA